eukprot:4070235-Amphidinium_carterae.4
MISRLVNSSAVHQLNTAIHGNKIQSGRAFDDEVKIVTVMNKRASHAFKQLAMDNGWLKEP